MKVELVEKELATALYRFSYGRLSAQEAAEKAHVIAPKIDTSNPMIAHKGINWYAKQVLKASK